MCLYWGKRTHSFSFIIILITLNYDVLEMMGGLNLLPPQEESSLDTKDSVAKL